MNLIHICVPLAPWSWQQLSQVSLSHPFLFDQHFCAFQCLIIDRLQSISDFSRPLYLPNEGSPPPGTRQWPFSVDPPHPNHKCHYLTSSCPQLKLNTKGKHCTLVSRLPLPSELFLTKRSPSNPTTMLVTPSAIKSE